MYKTEAVPLGADAKLSAVFKYKPAADVPLYPNDDEAPVTEPLICAIRFEVVVVVPTKSCSLTVKIPEDDEAEQPTPKDPNCTFALVFIDCGKLKVIAPVLADAII